MLVRYAAFVVAGAVCGALFGAAFGAFASVFHSGPELMVGVTESWGWFAALGAFAGLGIVHTRQMDERRSVRPRER